MKAVSSVPHPLAGSAAAEAYACGGTAIDAGIAASLALAVVEPESSGLAGQALILVRKAGETVRYVDAYSIAPAMVYQGMYEWIPSETLGGYRFATRDALNTLGPLAVAVPGFLFGVKYLVDNYATLPLHVLATPAIRYARHGFSVSQPLARAIGNHAAKLARYPSSRAIWFDDQGCPLARGCVVRQEGLARALEVFCAEGHVPFYEGEVGDAIVEILQLEGKSVLTKRDLEEAASRLPRIAEPLEVAYQEGRLASAAWPSAGGALVLLMLCVGRELGMAARGAAALPAIAETLAAGFRQRASLGDSFSPEGTAATRLLTRASILRLAEEIGDALHRSHRRDPAKLSGECRAEERWSRTREECTTHHSHMDSFGNALSITQSLGDEFGCGLVEPRFGLLLNNAMKLFDPRSKDGNAIRPFGKPLSSMAPTIGMKGDEPWFCIGSPSGTRIVSAIFQVCVNFLELGMPVTESVDQARLHYYCGQFEAEAHMNAESQRVLQDAGYDVKFREQYADWFGCVQVTVANQGELTAASDPRRPGVTVSHRYVSGDEET